MRITGNTILITGGGSGIGLALARAFLERDNQVLVCGRDPEKLDAVRQETPGLHTFRCDITQQDENQALMGHIQDRFPEINMLVNNAAISQQVDLAGGTADISRIHQDILTNLVAPIDLTIALTQLKDIVTTAPLTGGENDVLPGSDADLTIALTQRLKHRILNTLLCVLSRIPALPEIRSYSAQDRSSLLLVYGLGIILLLNNEFLITHDRQKTQTGSRHNVRHPIWSGLCLI